MMMMLMMMALMMMMLMMVVMMMTMMMMMMIMITCCFDVDLAADGQGWEGQGGSGPWLHLGRVGTSDPSK